MSDIGQVLRSPKIQHEIPTEGRQRSMKESIQHLEDVSGNLLDQMNELSARLGSMEGQIKIMHMKTQKLMLAEENVSKVISAFDIMKRQYYTSELAERVIQRGPSNDVDDYLATMDKVYVAIDFFFKNSAIENSQGELNRLRSVALAGVKQLEAFVKSKLDSKALDLKSYKTEDTFPRMSEADLDILRRTFEVLFQFGKSNLTSIFRSSREIFVTKSLLGLNPDKIAAEKVDGRSYQKGQHPFVIYLNSFVKLLLSEADYIVSMLGSESLVVVDPMFHQSTNYFGVISEGVVESLERKMTRGAFDMFNIFIFLDILEDAETALDRIREAISIECEAYVRIKKLHDVVMAIIRSFFQNSFVDLVKSYPVKVYGDANVSEVTTMTLSLLKQLVEYRDHIIRLLPDPPREEKQHSDTLGYLILLALNALIENLTTSSKQLKSQPLESLFLLSNINFVQKSVQQSNLALITGRPELERFRTLVIQQTDAYMKNWVKAVAFLLDKQQLRQKKEKQITKAKFSDFNNEFERLRNVLSGVIISDEELRTFIRKKTVELVMPIYTEFYQSNTQVPFCKNMSKYVKYSDDTLSAMLNKLF